MTQNELREMKCDALKEVMKGIGVSFYKGKNRMNKEEMIEEILKYQKDNDICIEVKTQDEKCCCNDDSCNIQESTEVNDNKNNDFIDEKPFMPDLKVKRGYVELAKVGNLIAFFDENGKARTGKMVNRSSKREVLKVVTEYDVEFVIPFDKILWVRTESEVRWPRWIYNLLKGRTRIEKENKN